MDGLLDFLKTPEGQGLLSAGMGYLATAQRGTPVNNIGKAGLAGMLGYSNAISRQQQQEENAVQNQVRQMQMQKMQAELAQQQRRQGQMESYRNTLPEQDRGVFDLAPDKYLEHLPQFQKPQLVEVADPNEPLRTQKVWMRPGDMQGTVAGYGAMPEILDPRVQGAKERIARAGAVNIAPKIEVKTGESIAGQIGPMLKDSRAMAISGVKLVDSAGRVLDAAESGNIYAGPAANLRLKGAQVADVLGLGGKTTAEKIANTRAVVRGMSEQAVAARSQLGGQAQISNSEQELLNKATSGEISELTVDEILQIAKLNDKLGRQMYEIHTGQLGNLGGDPNLAGLAKFYAVPPMPAARKAQQSQAVSGPPPGAVRLKGQ